MIERIVNRWIRHKTKNLTRIPLFMMTFNYAPIKNLDLQDINNNPQKYNGYEPVKMPSDLERIDAQVTYTAKDLS